MKEIRLQLNRGSRGGFLKAAFGLLVAFVVLVQSLAPVSAQIFAVMTCCPSTPLPASDGGYGNAKFISLDCSKLPECCRRMKNDCPMMKRTAQLKMDSKPGLLSALSRSCTFRLDRYGFDRVSILSAGLLPELVSQPASTSRIPAPCAMPEAAVLPAWFARPPPNLISLVLISSHSLRAPPHCI